MLDSATPYHLVRSVSVYPTQCLARGLGAGGTALVETEMHRGWKNNSRWIAAAGVVDAVADGKARSNLDLHPFDHCSRLRPTDGRLMDSWRRRDECRP